MGHSLPPEPLEVALDYGAAHISIPLQPGHGWGVGSQLLCSSHNSPGGSPDRKSHGLEDLWWSTMSLQLGMAVTEATAPLQHALSARAEGSCLANATLAVTELPPVFCALRGRCGKLWPCCVACSLREACVLFLRSAAAVFGVHAVLVSIKAAISSTQGSSHFCTTLRNISCALIQI